eukprot:jgi/Mesvir1/17757/Mv18994-RA.1
METRASSKNKMVTDQGASVTSPPKRACCPHRSIAHSAESSEPSVARWTEENEENSADNDNGAEDTAGNKTPVRADAEQEDFPPASLPSALSTSPRDKCTNPRAVLVDVARVVKGGIKYSVEHVCKVDRIVTEVSTCVPGAHEFSYKHNMRARFGNPACFVCKQPVELISVDSDMGKEILANLHFACPNNGCDFHGLYDSFSSHQCAHKEKRCDNHTVVEGVKLGCMMTVAGTSAPHKCQYDFSECPELAKRSYFRELHRTGLISDAVFFFLMNYC